MYNEFVTIADGDTGFIWLCRQQGDKLHWLYPVGNIETSTLQSADTAQELCAFDPDMITVVS